MVNIEHRRHRESYFGAWGSDFSERSSEVKPDLKPGRFNSRRWATAFMAGAVVLSLGAVMSMPGKAGAEELGRLKVGVKCVDSNQAQNDPRFVLPPGIQVSIKGEYPKMPSSPLIPMGGYWAPKEVVWLTLEDAQAGTARTLTYGALQVDNVTANMDRYLSSIRNFRKEGGLQGDPNYIRPFRTYRLRMGTGLNTVDDQPRITSTIASAAFSANCIEGPKAELFPDWSLPEQARVMPVRTGLQRDF